jgi:cytochrome d ubiquinol oxidase subunit II
VTTVAMFAMHGAIFLTMKTEGELLARIERNLPRLIVAFFVLNTLVVVAMIMFRQHITERYTTDIWPVIFPAAALLALVAAWRFLRRGERFLAFIASAATIGLLIVSGAIGLYPNLLISTTDTANNLTVTNAAAADNTLTVALVVAVIGIPFVLTYTAGVYYFFRGKTVVAPDSY